MTVGNLNWSWIALMAIVPSVVACGVAYPFWRRRETIFGNIVGATVIFGTAVVLILREYSAIDRQTTACLAAGYSCWPEPSAFTRYAVYAGLGLLEVFALFAVSLTVEQRIRSRDYAPEWR